MTNENEAQIFKPNYEKIAGASPCVYGNPDCQICKNFPNVFDAGTSLHYSNLSDPTFKSQQDARLLAHFLTSLSDIIAYFVSLYQKFTKKK